VLRWGVLPSALSDIANGNVLALLALSFAQPAAQPLRSINSIL
jgi:hypothetical protein